MTDDTLTQLRLLRSPSHQHIFVTMQERTRYRAHDTHYRVFKTVLAACEDQLIELNGRGAGVFLQVNRDHMKGWKRSAKNVSEATALFLDFDSDFLPALPFEPTLLIRTRRGHHAWYALHPTADLLTWKSVARGMAGRLGADPQCTALNQLGRLAGFDQHKKGSFKTSIVAAADSVYSLQQFADWLDLKVAPEADAFEPKFELATSDAVKFPFPLLRQILSSAAAAVRSARTKSLQLTLGRQAWHLGHFLPAGLPYPLAMSCLLDAAGLAADPAAKRMVHDALVSGCKHSRCHPPFVSDGLRAALQAEQLRTMYVDRATQSIGNEVVIQHVLRESGDWSICFDSEGQARHGLADRLRDLGYVPRKCKRQGEWVYLWERKSVQRPICDHLLPT